MAATSDAGPSADETTERILDAALTCFSQGPVSRTTMNSIADAAGVGVATVYRRFPQKEQLVQAVVMREAADLVAAVQSAIVECETVDAQVVAGFVTFTQQLAKRTLLNELADTSLRRAMNAAPDHGSPILGVGRHYIAELIRRWQRVGALSDFDADLVGEVFARLGHSLAVIPAGVIPLDNAERTREFARRYLIPLLHPAPR